MSTPPTRDHGKFFGMGFATANGVPNGFGMVFAIPLQ